MELLFFGLLEEESLHCFVHSGILEHVVFLSEELQEKHSPKSLQGTHQCLLLWKKTVNAEDETDNVMWYINYSNYV